MALFFAIVDSLYIHNGRSNQETIELLKNQSRQQPKRQWQQQEQQPKKKSNNLGS